jgi:hypothetical protein
MVRRDKYGKNLIMIPELLLWAVIISAVTINTENAMCYFYSMQFFVSMSLVLFQSSVFFFFFLGGGGGGGGWAG